jgi:uncharacterized protein (DUF608 family)
MKRNKVVSHLALWLVALLIICLAVTCRSGSETAGLSGQWPVLKHYDREHVDRIALPLGGIGTGTVSLGGRGNLRDWEVMNRPAKGYHPGPRFEIAPFFVLFTEVDGQKDTRLLEGPVPPYEYEGERGVFRITNHGMPRFEESTFEAAYPFGQVNLHHPGLPVSVRIKGFNPLIPADADKSGIPAAFLEFELHNRTEAELDAAICFSMQNFIGDDGRFGVADRNRNLFREDQGLKGIFLVSESGDTASEQWGTLAVTTTSVEKVSYRTSWKRQHWGSSVLDFWDDFSEDGMLEERPATDEDRPMASLSAKIKLAPGEKRSVEFLISWHFPNRKAWSLEVLQNYYTTRYADAWDVAARILPEKEGLEEKTLDFVHAFLDTELPEVVKEAALFNISTLRTQTCFRTADGYFYTWEGCNDNTGCCFGSCTHVWNYEHATGFLFGELAKRKREIEFGMATYQDGLMNFRVRLPLEQALSFGRAAADGQMGAILKMYRDWQLSGDDEMLDRLWPNVKKTIAFCWVQGGWDADMDGVMEGVQHNTMDVEYYGPNPQMGIWYLGALRAMEEMARHQGEEDFAVRCRGLYERGSKWLDENLFNGEYYIHKIQVPQNLDEIHPNLVVGMGGENRLDPDYQLGEGCLVDQLVGQYVAHVCGLGYLVDPQNLRTTLKSILKYNYREDLSDHFNCFRSYALGNEAALLMASYPYSRPVNPFPYFTEVMTGFEYTAAVGMLYEGLLEEGLMCIRNIRDRYDGWKRNPFDEAECGHHYGRAMASWSAVLALTGFRYSAVDQDMAFNPEKGKYFWSNGYQYGTVEILESRDQMTVSLSLLAGELTLKSLTLKDYGQTAFPGGKTFRAGQPVEIEVVKSI